MPHSTVHDQDRPVASVLVHEVLPLLAPPLSSVATATHVHALGVSLDMLVSLALVDTQTTLPAKELASCSLSGKQRPLSTAAAAGSVSEATASHVHNTHAVECSTIVNARLTLAAVCIAAVVQEGGSAVYSHPVVQHMMQSMLRVMQDVLQPKVNTHQQDNLTQMSQPMYNATPFAVLHALGHAAVVLAAAAAQDSTNSTQCAALLVHAWYLLCLAQQHAGDWCTTAHHSKTASTHIAQTWQQWSMAAALLPEAILHQQHQEVVSQILSSDMSGIVQQPAHLLLLECMLGPPAGTPRACAPTLSTLDQLQLLHLLTSAHQQHPVLLARCCMLLCTWLQRYTPQESLLADALSTFLTPLLSWQPGHAAAGLRVAALCTLRQALVCISTGMFSSMQHLLLQCMMDEDVLVRQAACECLCDALATMGDHALADGQHTLDLVRAVVQCMDDQDARTRHTALRAFTVLSRAHPQSDAAHSIDSLLETGRTKAALLINADC